MAVVQFARGQGPTLRARMAADATFRGQFQELWVALLRVCSAPGHPLELYLDEPAVWDVLLRPGGDELLRWRGLLAVALLHGPKAYPKHLHDRVAGLLLAGDGTTFTSLHDGAFREHPQFRDLLATKLPDDLLAAGGNYALKPHSRPPSPVAGRGREWIPFYTAAVVAGKLLTGERVTDDQWAGGRPRCRRGGGAGGADRPRRHTEPEAGGGYGRLQARHRRQGCRDGLRPRSSAVVGDRPADAVAAGGRCGRTPPVGRCHVRRPRGVPADFGRPERVRPVHRPGSPRVPAAGRPGRRPPRPAKHVAGDA